MSFSLLYSLNHCKKNKNPIFFFLKKLKLGGKKGNGNFFYFILKNLYFSIYSLSFTNITPKLFLSAKVGYMINFKSFCYLIHRLVCCSHCPLASLAGRIFIISPKCGAPPAHRLANP